MLRVKELHSAVARLQRGADLWPERVQNCLVHAQQSLPVGFPAEQRAGLRLCTSHGRWRHDSPALVLPGRRGSRPYSTRACASPAAQQTEAESATLQ